MFKRSLRIAVLGFSVFATLLASACASDEAARQNGQAGTPSTTGNNYARYSDSKHRYHSEWVGQPGR
jgi:hypothetical protein